MLNADKLTSTKVTGKAFKVSLSKTLDAVVSPLTPSKVGKVSILAMITEGVAPRTEIVFVT